MHDLLPYDGPSVYHGVVFGVEDQERLFSSLLGGIVWASDELVMFGRHVVTARKVAWHGDHGVSYRYSGTTKRPQGWSRELLEIRERVEDLCAERFNSCLLNRYHHGGEGMGWHSDDESSLRVGGAIASVSFGAARRFVFRHRTSREKIGVILEPGSLLVMAGRTQACWQHSLPKMARVKQERVNLTFRQVAGG